MGGPILVGLDFQKLLYFCGKKCSKDADGKQILCTGHPVVHPFKTAAGNIPAERFCAEFMRNNPVVAIMMKCLECSYNTTVPALTNHHPCPWCEKKCKKGESPPQLKVWTIARQQRAINNAAGSDGVPENKNAVPICNLHNCRLITPIAGPEYDDGQGFDNEPATIERGLNERVPNDGVNERIYTYYDMVNEVVTYAEMLMEDRILHPGEWIEIDYLEDFTPSAPDKDEMFIRRVPHGEIRWMLCTLPNPHRHTGAGAGLAGRHRSIHIVSVPRCH